MESQKIKLALLKSDSDTRAILNLIDAVNEQQDPSAALLYWAKRATGILCRDGVERLENMKDVLLLKQVDVLFQGMDEVPPVHDDD